MTEQAYIEPVASHQDDPDVKISSPVTSAYTQLPYTATTVPPFSYPPPSDQLLLTPISLAGSPPIPHAAKLMHQYNSPPATSSSQLPTPPATAIMYWAPSFDLSAPQGRADSPMDPDHHSSTSATPSHFEMAYITTEGTRDDIPEPPGPPFFGHYGVSETEKPDQNDRLAYYGMHNVGPPQPLIMEQHLGDQIQHHSNMTMRTPLPHDPLTVSSEAHTLQQASNMVAEPPRSSRGSPSHSACNEAHAGRDRAFRVSKKAGKQRSRPNRTRAHSASQNRHEEIIQFKDRVPEEERFLIELRLQYQGVKGKTMWDDIGAEFAKKFGRRPGKAALQMKLSRAKPKYIQWSDEDLELLREAYIEDEKERYKRISRKLQDRRGGKNITFSERSVECQLVELGLEALYVDPDTNIRARTKVGERRPSATRNDPQPSHVRMLPTQFYDGTPSFGLSGDQKELLYQQLDRRGMSDDEGSTMEMVIQDGDGDPVREEVQQEMPMVQQLPISHHSGHMGHVFAEQGKGGTMR